MPLEPPITRMRFSLKSSSFIGRFLFRYVRHCEEQSDEAIQSLSYDPGLLRGGCHRARIRATRWLAMTGIDIGIPDSTFLQSARETANQPGKYACSNQADPSAFRRRSIRRRPDQPLTSDEAAAVEAGMDRYAVLVFHGQDITDDQQMAFARNFGEIENRAGGNIVKPQEKRLWSRAERRLQPRPGRPAAAARRPPPHLFNLGNRLWHSDSLVPRRSGEILALSARVVEPKGGNTEFADMRAAYDALDDNTKARVEALIASTR